MEEILKKIGDLVAEGEEDDAVEATREALEMGIDPMKILQDGASKGMDVISEQYNEGEAFLPELVLAGDAMTAVIELLFENMDAETAATSKVGTIVMGQMGLFHLAAGAQAEMYVLVAIIVAQMYIRHRGNIHRLLTHTERKTYFHHHE